MPDRPRLAAWPGVLARALRSRRRVPQAGFRPLRAVIDTCVFARLHDWMKPIVLAARAGHVQLYWSPFIIAEVNRLLTWQWLKHRHGDLSDGSWRACSDRAHRWFTHMTPVFRVVEDAPPPEPLWTDKPADDWDWPVWTAAIRARADFIVTENLRDGPPPDRDGIQRHAGVFFLHPDRFLAVVDWYADLVVGAQLPELAPETPSRPQAATAAASASEDPIETLSPSVREFLLKLLSREPQEPRK